jgi:SAM-dependent methyltransferase
MAFKDYYNGEKDAVILLYNNFGEPTEELVETYFRDPTKIELEKAILDLCRGRILDIGAGAGCHSLVLQEKGYDVHSIDISPGAVELMKQRGLKHVYCRDIWKFRSKSFDTLLLMFNGIGIAGDLKGLAKFLKQLKKLVKPDGQILAGVFNTSFSQDGDPDRDYSIITFSLEYQGVRSQPSKWLFLDSNLLCQFAQENGWQCEITFFYNGACYLAQLKRGI